MNKKICNVLPLLLLFLGIALNQNVLPRDADAPHLMLGQNARLQGAKSLFNVIIKFPKSVKTVPSTRVYWKGYRLTCKPDDYGSNKASFIISDENPRPKFKILITEHVQVVGEQNVVKYLKVPTNAKFNFYVCYLERKPVGATDKKQKSEHTPKWQINKYDEEQNPLNNGIIPDDTIIVCLNRDYVDCVEGGSTTLLPTIKLRSDLLKLVESEEKLHANADELLLSLLDTDTMHAAMTHDIKPHFQRKMIVATLTATT